jgi:hypothetical protein
MCGGTPAVGMARAVAGHGGFPVDRNASAAFQTVRSQASSPSHRFLTLRDAHRRNADTSPEAARSARRDAAQHPNTASFSLGIS